MKKTNDRLSRTMMTSASIAALCALAPSLAGAQAVLNGAPGQALTAGTITTTTSGGILDGGTGSGVSVTTGVNGQVGVTDAVIAVTANTWSGVSVSSLDTTAGQILVTLDGVNSIQGGSAAVSVYTDTQDILLDSSGGLGTYVGAVSNGTGLGASSLNGSVAILNGANTISGGAVGVLGAAYRTGDVSIGSKGGTIVSAVGVRALSYGGDVTIGADGGVTTAITATSAGSAINATTSGAGGIAVTTAAGGKLEGGANTVFAVTDGTGDVQVTLGDTVGATTRSAYAAIYAQSAGGDVGVDATAAIRAGAGGISTNTSGAGDITLSTVGVDSTSSNAVFGRTTGSGDISYTLNGPGAVTGATGVYLTTSGAGALSVTATDAGSSFIGTTGNGVDLRGAGGQIDVDVAGSIQGDGVGVYVATGGAGAITVHAGSVSARTGNAVSANNSTVGGAGTVSIGTADRRLGSATSTNATAIFASSQGDVNVYATGVTAGTRGIVAASQGTAPNGDVVVDVSGVINAGSYGIIGVNYGEAVGNDLTIRTAGAITAGTGTAISAEAVNGDISITADGALKSTGSNGVWAKAYENGNIGVVTNGTVEGVWAIYANATAATTGGAIDITATQTVTGKYEGVGAESTGDGKITLDLADVVATEGHGVFANGKRDISISTGAVTATGGGAITLDPFNDATGVTGAAGYAINATSSLGAVDVTSTGTLTGGAAGGLYVRSAAGDGAGGVTLDLADVTAGVGRGIEVSSAGGAVTVTAGAITAATDGVRVRGWGDGSTAGAITVGTASDRIGAVNAAGGTGLFATGSGDVSIYATNVTAATRGVLASSQGSNPDGKVVIDVNGTVVAGGSYGVLGLNNGVLAANTVSITTGAVTSTGGSAISAQANAGDITVVANGAIQANASQATGSWDGVYAEGYDDNNISITAHGAVTGSYNGIEAFLRSAVDHGAIDITADAAIRGQTGVVAISTGKGGIDLDLAAVTGTNGPGVFASGAGAVSVSTGAVTATNGGGVSQNGLSDVTGVNQSSGYGVIALSSGGAIDVTTAGLVTGGAAGGIFAQTTGGTGAITVATADVTAASGRAIEIQSAGGAVSVTTGTISAQTDGVRVRGGAAAVSLGSATQRIGAVTSGGTGLFATGSGDVSVYASTIDAGTRGVVASSQGANPNGKVLIDIGGDIDAASTFGIVGRNNGVLNVNSLTIRSAGTVTSTGGSAISAQTVGGDIVIDANSAIANNGTGGSTWDGVYAESDQAALISILTRGAVSGGYNGVEAISGVGGANGGVIVETRGDVTGAQAAIRAQVRGVGNINVTTAAGTTLKGAVGVSAATVGAGDITIANNAAIVTAGTGILATTEAGDIAVTTGATGTISPGAAAGINASTATGSITINQAGSIGVAGDNGWVGTGIRAEILGGSQDLVINSSGGIYVAPGSGQQSAGIYAVNHGTGAVVVTTSGIIDPGAYGVVVEGAGDVTYTAAGGVAEGDIGASVVSTGSGTVTVTAAAGAVVRGFDGAGFVVSSAGGDVSVVNAGSVSGSTQGLVVSTSGAGSTSLTTTGTVSGASGVGIAATSGTGGLELNIGGSVISASGPAIQAVSTGGGTINIASGAVIAGKIDSANSAVITLDTAKGEHSTLNVASGATIQSVSGSVYDVALRATGGSVVVNNSGTIAGRVDFSALTGADSGQLVSAAGTNFETGGESIFAAGDDAFGNSGKLITLGALTTFDFRSGTNVLTNGGTVYVGFNPVAVGGSSFVLKSLTRFNNSGVLEMANGVIGDSIVATGSSYVGSGAALLSIDAALSAGGKADTLTVGTSSGVTKVRVADRASGFGALNLTGTAVVVGTTHAGDFMLDSGSSWYNAAIFGGAIDKPGLFFSQLANASTGTVLVSAPKTQAYQFATLAAQAQGLWHGAADRGARNAELRDALDPAAKADAPSAKTGFWFKADAARAERQTGQSLTLLSNTYAYDASYKQDSTNATIGFDAVNAASNGGLAWGAALGYAQAKARFDQYDTLTKLQGPVLSGYASWLSGGTFVSATVAASQLNAKLAASQLAGWTQQKADVTSLGGAVEAGLRRPFFGGAVIEPSLGVTYVDTSIDDVSTAGTTFRFEDAKSVRASLGARVTGVLAPSEAWTTRYAVSVRVVDELKGKNDVTLLSAGAPFKITDKAFDGAYGEFGFNLSSRSKSGWTGFVDAKLRANDAYSEAGASLGLRLRY